MKIFCAFLSLLFWGYLGAPLLQAQACPASISSISPLRGCPGTTFTLTCANPGPGCTINWQVSPGQILSGQGSTSIQVLVPATTPPGPILISLDVTDANSQTNTDFGFLDIAYPQLLFRGNLNYPGSCIGGDTVGFALGENTTCQPVPWDSKVWYDSFAVAGATILGTYTHPFVCDGDSVRVLTQNAQGFTVFGYCHSSTCSQIDTFQFVASPGLQSGFTFSSQSLSVQVNSQAQQADSTWYLWGDGQSDTLTTHPYAGPGSYLICQVVQDVCQNQDSSCQWVTLSCPAPLSGFSYSSTQLQTQFTDQSGNGPTAWLWDFGDGNSSVLQNPIHTYAQAGTYTVCLVANNACGSDSSCQTLTVTCPAPAANFGFSINQANVTFSDSSGNSPSSWQWDFGDGNSSTQSSPSHSYQSSGTYQVCLRVENDCGIDSACQSLTILILGSPDHSNPELHLFPNPSRGYLTLTGLSALQDIRTFRLVNTLGQVIYELRGHQALASDRIDLNLPHLPSGSYWLIIGTTNKQVRLPIKLIK